MPALPLSTRLRLVLLPLLLATVDHFACADVCVDDGANFSIAGFTDISARKEFWSHYHLAAQMINDATDGFYDNVYLSRNVAIYENNTACDAATAARNNFQIAWETQFVGYAGAYCSSASLAIAQQLREIDSSPTQISPSSSSPALVNYEYFLRLIPSDVLQAFSLASVVNKYGWTRVGVLYDDDAYGRGLNVSFAEAAESYGIEVVVHAPVDSSSTDQQQLAIPLLKLLRHGVRVVVAAIHLETAQTLLSFAVAQTPPLMVGDQFQWIAVDGWATSDLWLDDPAIQEYAAGWLGTSPYVNTSRPQYQAYLNRWRNSDLYDGDGDRSTIDTYGSQCADVVFAYAHAIQDLEELGEDVYDRDNMLRALYNVSFEGISGKVDFNRTVSVGTLEMQAHAVSRPYSITNCNGSEWQELGTYDPTTLVFDPNPLDTATFVDGTHNPIPDSFNMSLIMVVDSTDSFDYTAELQAHALKAMRMINDKSDGAFDPDADSEAWPVGASAFVFSGLQVFDAECDAEVMQSLLTNAQYEFLNATAIIGAQCSETSTLLAEWGTQYEVPVITYATELDDITVDNALFARAVPPNHETAETVVALVEQYLWTKVLLLYQADDFYSLDMKQDIVANLTDTTFHEYYINSSYSDGDIRSVLKQMQNQDLRYMLFVASVDMVPRVIEIADDEGLMDPQGKNSYVWIGTDTMGTDNIAADYADFLLGCLAIRPHPVLYPPLDEVPPYLSIWRGLDNKTYPDTDGFRQNITLYGAYAFDSVLAVAHSLSQSFQYNRDWTDGSQVYASMVADEINGLTGELVFDEFGDRDGNTQVANLQATPSIRLQHSWLGAYTYDATSGGGGELNVDSSAVDIVWPGGYNEPLDEVIDTSTSRAPLDVTTPVLVVLVGFFVAFVLVVGFLCYSTTAGFKGKKKKANRISSKAVSMENETQDDSAGGDTNAILRVSMAEYKDSEDIGDEEEEEELDLPPQIICAAIYCWSALYGLPEIPSRVIKHYTYDVFQAYFSEAYQGKFFPIVSIIHMSLAFWESPRATKAPEDTQTFTLLVSIELCCICIYLLDVYLTSVALSGHLFRWKRSIVYIILVFGVTVDCLMTFVSGGSTYRFSRPLRAAIPVVHSQSLEADIKKIFYSALASIDVVLVFFFLVTWFAVLGIGLFGAIHCSSDTDCTTESFTTFSRAYVSLFVLIQLDNYPDLAWPAIDITKLAYVYFVGYILFVFVFFAILLAKVFDTYVDARRRQVQVMLKRETQNLMAAFEQLANHDANDLRKRDSAGVTYGTFRMLMLLFHPKLPESMVRYMFDQVDEDKDQVIVAQDFLKLSEYLLKDITVLEEDEVRRRNFVTKVLGHNLRGNEALLKVLDSWPALCFMLAASLSSAVVLCQLNMENPDGSHNTLLLSVDNCFMSLSLFDMCLRVYALGWDEFASKMRHRTAMVLILTSSVGVGIVELLGFGVSASVTFRSFRMLRALILMDHIMQTHFHISYFEIDIIKIFQQVRLTTRIFLRMATMLLVVAYCFGVIGMEVWSDRLSKCSDDGKDCVARVDGYETPRTNFNTFGDALEVMFEFFSKSELGNLLSATVTISGFPAVYYWLTLYVLMIVFLVNIFNAVVIEAYQIKRKPPKHRVEVEGRIYRIKPSKVNKRFREDLELEEARDFATKQAASEIRGLMDIRAEFAERQLLSNADIELDSEDEDNLWLVGKQRTLIKPKESKFAKQKRRRRMTSAASDGEHSRSSAWDLSDDEDELGQSDLHETANPAAGGGDRGIEMRKQRSGWSSGSEDDEDIMLQDDDEEEEIDEFEQLQRLTDLHNDPSLATHEMASRLRVALPSEAMNFKSLYEFYENGGDPSEIAARFVGITSAAFHAHATQSSEDFEAMVVMYEDLKDLVRRNFQNRKYFDESSFLRTWTNFVQNMEKEGHPRKWTATSVHENRGGKLFWWIDFEKEGEQDVQVGPWTSVYKSYAQPCTINAKTKDSKGTLQSLFSQK